MRSITIIERDDGTLEILRDERQIDARSFPTHNEYYLTKYAIIVQPLNLDTGIDSSTVDGEPVSLDVPSMASHIAKNLEFISSCGPELSNCGGAE